MTIGPEDPAASMVVRALTERSGVGLSWTRTTNGLPALRVAGPDPQHGVAITLDRRNFAVSSELVPEPYAGGLLRMMGENVTGDRQLWRGLFDEGRARGQSLTVLVNGEVVEEVDDLPDDTWRTLEFEASIRLAACGGDPALALEEVATTSLSLILAGIDPNPDEVEEDDSEQVSALEGTARRMLANRYERSRANRLRCIRHYGATCWVCDFDFKQRYGPAGDGLIVVHHVVPVSQLGPAYRLNPLRDLVPLCDNCHRMVHTQDPPISPEALRASLNLDPKPPRG